MRPSRGWTRRRTIAGAAALFAAPVSARAEDYPTRPITLLVGFAPGGAVDIVARSLAGELQKRVGQSVATFHVTPKSQHKSKRARKAR